MVFESLELYPFIAIEYPYLGIHELTVIFFETKSSTSEYSTYPSFISSTIVNLYSPAQ